MKHFSAYLLITAVHAKVVNKREYDENAVPCNEVYLFDNLNEFHNYFYINGLTSDYRENMDQVILKQFKDKSILAFKYDCDLLIKQSKIITDRLNDLSLSDYFMDDSPILASDKTDYASLLNKTIDQNNKIKMLKKN